MNPEPKRILLVAYACAPDKGAEAGNGWGWATLLAKKGYEVFCFTNIEDREAILAHKKLLNLENLHFIFISLKWNLDQKLLHTSSQKIYFHYYLWQKAAFKQAKKLHGQKHFYLAHHVSFGSMQQGSFICELQNVKKIFGPAGGGQQASPAFRQYFGSAWRIEKMRNIISWYAVKYSTRFKNTVLHCDHILVSNNDTALLASRVKGHNPQKIKILSDTCVPASMCGLALTERKESAVFKLLWLARMLPRKGLKLIFHALSFLPENLNYEITIVGDGEQASQLDSWIDEYKLNRKKLIFTGQVPYSTLSGYYRNADVFIMCALRDSFGSQLLEAMSFSLPVITLNQHGAALWVQDDCGIKINTGTAEETAHKIALAIIKMQEDAHFRQQCGSNAYHYSKTHTWESRVLQVTEQFY